MIEGSGFHPIRSWKRWHWLRIPLEERQRRLSESMRSVGDAFLNVNQSALSAAEAARIMNEASSD